MTGISVNLNCPSCGGTISITEGSLLSSCSYCDAALAVDGAEGVFKNLYKLAVDEKRARDVLAHWFSSGLKARDLSSKAGITELYAIYLPFWKYRARAAGWVCGYEERTVSGPKGSSRKVRVDHEKMVFRDFDWTRIACDAGDLGINSLRNLEGELLIHEDGSIPTYESTTSATDARNLGRDAVYGMAKSAADVQKITYENIHIIPRSLTLLHYPVWIARYEYAGRSYFATVDGVTGQILSGRAPGDPLYRSIIMTAGSMVGGLLAGAGLSFRFGPEAAVACLLVGAALFYGAYRFFRHGSEIVEGDIAKPYAMGGALK